MNGRNVKIVGSRKKEGTEKGNCKGFEFVIKKFFFQDSKGDLTQGLCGVHLCTSWQSRPKPWTFTPLS